MSARLCGHCGAENDGTRIFCTNCGSRLSAYNSPEIPEPEPEHTAKTPHPPLVTPPVAPPAEAPGLSAPRIHTPAAPRRVSRGGNSSIKPDSGRSTLSGFLGQLFITAVLAAILAAMIQICRPPDNVPPVQAPEETAAAQVMEQLRGGAAAPGASDWTVNDNAVNQFLATVVRAKDGDPGPLKPAFTRTCAAIEQGSFQLLVEEQFLRQRIYFSLTGVVVPSTDGPRVEWVGASAGRLPVHPALIPYFRVFFHQVLDALDPVTQLLKSAKAVNLNSGKATIQWSSSGRSRRPVSGTP